MRFESRDWSSLTEALLQDILRRLHILKDFMAFRGVCRSWRAIAAPNPYSLASQRPLLVLTRCPSFADVFYNVVDRSFYRAQSPRGVSSRRSIAYAHGYLVLATEQPCAKLRLWNIFTKATILLPMAPQLFDGMLFSSRPSYFGCLVLLFKRTTAVLQFLRIGDPLWKVVDCCETLQFLSDMIFFKNKLHALTDDMRLLAVDLVAGPKYEVLGAVKDSPIIRRLHLRRRLAVSGEELLAICYRLGRKFDVFRWDFTTNEWKEELTLGGRALFMGADGFAGSLASEMGLKKDCIYSLDYCNGQWLKFSLKDQSVKAFPYILPGLVTGRAAVPPIWVLPSIC